MRNSLSRPFLFLWIAVGCLLAFSAGKARGEDHFKLPWTLTYQDGSGNTYHFQKDSEKTKACFTYSPVRPKDSSSGFYSGGAAKQGCLNKKEVAELVGWISKLEADVERHTSRRMKGTGKVELKDDSGTRSFIVQHEKPLREFNDFLKKLR